MLHDLEDSPAIQMEVEEVNQSQKLTTKQQSNTKEPSTKNTTSAISPAMADRAACNHDWDCGLSHNDPVYVCKKCGKVDY